MSLVEKLCQAVECPVCLEIPRQGPIQQCTNGHLVCQGCSKKIVECPTCRIKLEPNRSLLADTVLEFVPTRCRFHAHGCDVKLPKEARVEHEKICEFREVQCPSQTCGSRPSLVDLMEHVKPHMMKKFLSENSVLTERFQILPRDLSSKEKIYWFPSQIDFKQRQFFCVFGKVQHVWSLWVYLVGTPDEALGFQFTATCENDKGEKFSFTSLVSSIDTPHDEVIESGAACTLSKGNIKRFLEEADDAFEVKIKFHQI